MDYENDTTMEDAGVESPTPRMDMGGDASRRWMGGGQSKPSLPPLNVKNAYKILNGYANNPEWLANPLTTHAANSVFAQASKVISLNLQMERLKKGAAAAAGQNRMGNLVVDNANKASLIDPSSMAWIYEKDDEGDGMKLENPKHWAQIQKQASAILATAKEKTNEIPTEWNRDPNKNYVTPRGGVVLAETDKSKTPTLASKPVVDRALEAKKTRYQNEIDSAEVSLAELNAVSEPDQDKIASAKSRLQKWQTKLDALTPKPADDGLGTKEKPYIVLSDEEYNNLAPGKFYQDSTGKLHIKKSQ